MKEAMESVNASGQEFQLTKSNIASTAKIFVSDLERLWSLRREASKNKKGQEGKVLFRFIDRAVTTRSRELSRLGYADEVKRITNRKRMP